MLEATSFWRELTRFMYCSRLAPTLSSMWPSECNPRASRDRWIFIHLERQSVLNLTKTVEISTVGEKNTNEDYQKYFDFRDRRSVDVYSGTGAGARRSSRRSAASPA